MEFPDNLRYTNKHEWVREEDDGSIVMGITDYAQDELGDIVFIELPKISDDIVNKDDPFAVVESVKAVSDIYAPVMGKVVEVNDELPGSPQIINEDCYGDGWLLRMEPTEEGYAEDLMTGAEYQELVDELS